MDGSDRACEGLNGFKTSFEPSELASSRFIEIPALRATALFRRSALVELQNKTHANALYRDIWPNPQGVVVDYASLDAKAPVLDGLPHRWWPVDSDFWHRWFHHDFIVAKISRNLYIWRQYSAQSTRTHNRCSLEQLRRCKAYFFVAAVLEGKFAPSISEIRVYGVGQTLEAWKSAIQLEFAEQNGADETRVFSLPHKPGASRWSSKDAATPFYTSSRTAWRPRAPRFVAPSRDVSEATISVASSTSSSLESVCNPAARTLRRNKAYN